MIVVTIQNNKIVSSEVKDTIRALIQKKKKTLKTKQSFWPTQKFIFTEHLQYATLLLYMHNPI